MFVVEVFRKPMYGGEVMAVRSVYSNRTLELFWKTMEACGIDTNAALTILEEIGNKNNFDVQHLVNEDLGNVIPISDDDRIFIEHLKLNKQMRKFKRVTGLTDKTLRKMIKRGYAPVTTYERFVEAKRVWEQWLDKIEMKNRKQKIITRSMQKKRKMMEQDGYRMII